MLKNIKKFIKKINSNYKICAFIIFILALVVLIIAKNDDFDNYVKTILISLSINLISSIIIIYLIDIKKEMNNDKELHNKRKLLLREIVVPINVFDSVVINAYKSTVSKNEFEKFDFTKENVYKIMSNLEKMNNEKPGYIYDVKLKRTRTWKEIFITQVMEYINDMINFYNNKSYILPYDLNSYIYNIISANVNKSSWEHILMLKGNISTKDLLEVTNFKKILENTFNIKQVLIENYEFKGIFNIENSMFIKENIAPNFESSI